MTTVIGEGSKEIIEAHDDQTEVFENPSYSDPSHSMLSKDHFGLILNEPAGKIAQIVVVRSVEVLVAAFQDESCDIDRAIDQVHIPKIYCTISRGLTPSLSGLGSIPPPLLRNWKLPRATGNV